MFFKTVVVIAIFWEVFANEISCDKRKCPNVPVHYRELGCIPVIEKGKCCPSRFQCLDFKNIDPKKCFYKNKLKSDGEELDASLTSHLCAVECYCDTDQSTPANFMCAILECPEGFNRPDRKCILQYDDRSCCAKKTICDETEISKLAKCELDGQKYREGQRMYPKNPCYRCLCTRNFQNIPVQQNPNCKKIDCGISVFNTKQVRQGCVPIYYDDANCCPIGWRCPSNTDRIIRSRSQSTHKCEFGKLKLNIGDVINSDDKCDTCQCLLPPMIFCNKSSKCTAAPEN